MLTTDQVLGKGRYRIIGNFTQDNTGSLYEAYDTVSNTNVVLRETVGTSGGVMTPAQLDELNNAFAGEAKTLSEVRHESLLSVQDYFSEIDRHYLVMESVDGCDLTKFLAADEKMPALADVMKWADQVLAALDYLHSLPAPIIHRDIRPRSIRLTSNFKVKVLTAGIGDSEVIMATAGNPADGTVLNYRPLEQLWGGLDPASQKVISNSYDDRSRRILMQPLDARSDIYSVGATFYHLLTRTMPKDALERSIEILDGNSDPLTAPAEIDGSIPEEVSEVIMKAMELRREHRYDSAAIMRQVFETAQQRAKARRTAEPVTRVVPEPISETAAESAPAVKTSSEAIEEQRRAELRRLEMEADIERQRQEAERIKAAEEVVKSKSKPVEQAPAAAAEEDFLLEVEPVKTARDDFEWSVEISEQPSRKTAEVRAFSQNSAGVDFNIDVAPSSNMKFIVAGAGGLVVLVAILGWLFMGGPTSNAPQKAESPAQQNSQQVQTPVSTFSDANTASPATEQSPQITESVTVDGHSDSQAATKKKPTPIPAKTPEKKKVTVDDLINDN
jgi:serine/threonine protein kinase